MLPRLACLGLLLVSGVASAAAQPATRLFAEAGPMLNRDMTWGNEHSNAGVSVGGGLGLNDRWEIRALVDVPPAWTLVDSSNRYAGDPPVVIERVTFTVRARNRTVSVFATRRIRAGNRCHVLASFGLSSAKRADETTVTKETVSSGARVESEQPSRNWGGPVFAAGALIRLQRHVSVVPELRAVWYPAEEGGNSIVRAGVNVRWTF